MSEIFRSDARGLSAAMRVDPGASTPLHDHAELERIHVIEGAFSDDETTYHAGDFAVRAPGAMHAASSETGALVLLVYRK